MVDEFNSSWINVIDGSMMDWYNNFSPGFMFVVQNSHTFVKEIHTICCGVDSILWREKKIEEKDIMAQMCPKLHQELGITVGIVIWMCKHLFYMFKYVVIDSWFCVENWIVALAAKGVHGDALIKKCRYWTKSVPRESRRPEFCVKLGGGCRHVRVCQKKTVNIPYLINQIALLLDEDYGTLDDS